MKSVTKQKEDKLQKLWAKKMEILNILIKGVHLSKLTINNASQCRKYINKRFP